ncbi:phospholipid carrier-dependent glycosyltransferase [Luedemannella flava]|uniref:Polyprenol-phosphate-mannose--protein mannosyltransferase n=1 Tax=Luedemannella flava TaxID=349316 RepID=A0ABP4YI06_9ACTN
MTAAVLTPVASKVSDVLRRRLAPAMPAPWVAWSATAWVTVIAALTRFYHYGTPPGILFDELYYATEGQELLDHAVEWEPNGNYGAFVVHPPLGKWLIALGIQILGNNSLGWRLAPVIFGTLAVLILTRTAIRLFRSVVLGAAAGLLMAFDGFELVLSRIALLDIFVLFFVLASFACLVVDRDKRRERWLAALDNGLDVTAEGRAGRPPGGWAGVPWWRLASAVMLGCACGVKWSGIFYLPVFVLLILLWEVSLRRLVGKRRPWKEAFLDEIGWLVTYPALLVVTYLATWSGWFFTDHGWKRHYFQGELGKTELPVIGALQNLWQYHVDMLDASEKMSYHHPFQSWPWQWLILGRPVAIYYGSDPGCGQDPCSAVINLIGTPVLWWSFIPALLAMTWLGISRRDWRPLAIGLGAAAGILPWFYYMANGYRTMFYFYAAPSEPFLILAVVFVLGALINAPGVTASDRHLTVGQADRRLYGTAFAAVYIVAVGLCFWYFYSIWTAQSIVYDEWWHHMWLGNRWV